MRSKLSAQSLIFVAAIMLIGAGAQSVGAQTINITGTVVDTMTSAGISGAAVKLLEFPQFTATTNSAGVFSLTGDATAVRSSVAVASHKGEIALTNGSLTISGAAGSQRAMVDVFRSNGARTFHGDVALNASGFAKVNNLWTTPGFRFVEISLGVKRFTVSNVGGNNRVSFDVAAQGATAKTSAVYTLQVSASTYVTKTVSLSSIVVSAGTIKLVHDAQQTGVWTNVTPSGITIADEGLRAVVADPSRPSDLFMGAGAAGIWKSTDYGRGWSLLHAGFGYVPQGLCFAVLPTEPRTILVAATGGHGDVHKSTDGGITFRTTAGGLPSDLYSLAVDPYDGNHLISGFHEADGIAESNDAGETWHMVVSTGFPTGGVSWYPYFINTGVASTTAKSWIAIAQNAGSPTVTRDGGATWAVPTGSQGLTYPHGTSQVYQKESAIFVSGDGGPNGGGVYRSTDWGVTFTKVTPSTKAALVWGTPTHVYSMYSWSCFNCTIDPNFRVGSATGDTWTTPGVPAGMLMGTDHVAVTDDGSHYIFVGAMRNAGIWRYVEP